MCISPKHTKSVVTARFVIHNYLRTKVATQYTTNGSFAVIIADREAVQLGD